MTSLAYRSSASATGASTSPAVAAPASVALNDIVLLAFAMDQQPLATVTWPTGFQQVRARNVLGDGQTFRCAWKLATGSEPGTYTITTSASATPDWVCQSVAFSGRSTADGVVSITEEAGSNTLAASPISLAVPGVTARPNSDLCFFATLDVNAGTNTPTFAAPSSFIERQDANSGFASLTIDTQDNVSGATGTVTGTGTLGAGTAAWGGFLIAIERALTNGTSTAWVRS